MARAASREPTTYTSSPGPAIATASAATTWRPTGFTVAIERLHDQELHALEALVLDGWRPRCRSPQPVASSPPSQPTTAPNRWCGEQVVPHLAVELRDDHRSAPGVPGATRPMPIVDGRLHVGDRAAEQEVALAPEAVGEVDLERSDRGALDPGIGRLDDRGHRRGSR